MYETKGEAEKAGPARRVASGEQQAAARYFANELPGEEGELQEKHRKCPRCHIKDETLLLHRYFTCPCNKNTPSMVMGQTEYFETFQDDIEANPAQRLHMHLRRLRFRYRPPIHLPALLPVL